ncbi:MAG: bifunctional lysylphosphatidylglycerol flippase/synthetase MprF [Holophaga sp.]|nr:bifunctional lysylphosphatidylglycerol flippase/synthetase MprF [Holophaga sp.]
MMRKGLNRAIWPILSVALFLIATWALRHELQSYRFRDIILGLRSLSRGSVALAILFTALNYLVLTGYDALALRYVRRTLSYGKVALASFIGYAFSNNVGVSLLAGSAVRFRLYSVWGLSTLEIAKVVAFYSVTFWVGLLGVGGACFLLKPMPLPAQFHLPFATTLPLGALLLAVLCAYLAATVTLRRPLTIRQVEFQLPTFGTACTQTLLSVLDWVLAAAVLYALMPAGAGLTFPGFLGIFLLGQFAGVVSHVPGGLGVFEGILLALLPGGVPGGALFAALIAYRVIYYVMPLVFAAILLGGHEALERRESVARVGQFFGAWVPEVAPMVIALLTFIAGAVLLFSGATPELFQRVRLLRQVVPLPIMEFSHFLGGLMGVLLLVLARGLQKRVDAAYAGTALLLAGGIVVSLLKGLDFEEATFLAVLLLALLPCRKYFYRRSSLLVATFDPQWIAAIALVFLCAGWLALFSYHHVTYRNDLWWSFAFKGDASRALRATLGSVSLIFFFAVARLMRPAPAKPAAPSRDDLVQAVGIATESPQTSAYLALLGDKALLFSESGHSFLMYAVQGRSWVALGGPVGPEEEHAELLWAFCEEVDYYGGWPVFYEVGGRSLTHYLDLGLTLLKVGEEGRVPLTDFSLEGAQWKSVRNLLRRMERNGCSCSIIPRDQVAPLLPELKQVSDAWLAGKNTREKGFSLGYFDPDYLAYFPVAVVRSEGHIVAFASFWPGGCQEELSVDLMRSTADAPAGIMDYLFVQLFLWGRDHGYRWFNLGMAPFSGLESRSLAPLWTKIGAFLFRTGEHYYNFQGLRQYKEKFHPVWEPRYLACPGGVSLAPILANIAALVGRGLKGVVHK